jgi:hypothetical protein
MVKNGKRKNSFIEIPNRTQYDGIVFKNIIDPSLSSKRNIPQDTIVAFENSQIKRIEPQAVSEVTASQELNEEALPGYDRAMSEVDGIVQKSKQRGVDEAKTSDNVMSYVMGSKVYEDATDVQREALVRDVRKRFGLKEKSTILASTTTPVMNNTSNKLT